MRETRTIMGMPVSLAVSDDDVRRQDLEAVFAEFAAIDAQFSPFKEDSEISRFNRGEIAEREFTPHMREVLALCEKTKRETGGYFDIGRPDGTSIRAAWSRAGRSATRPLLLAEHGLLQFLRRRPAATSSAVASTSEGREWTVGIRNPFMRDEIVKVLRLQGHGIATSGNYIRGAAHL